jgi:hypothetical protein
MGGLKARKSRKRLGRRVKSWLALKLGDEGGYPKPGSNRK